MVFCNVFGEILVIFAFLVMMLYILIDYNYIGDNFLQSWSYLPDRQYFDCTLSNRKVNAVYEVVSNVRIEIIWKVNFLIVHSIIFFNILIIFAMLIFFGSSYKMWQWWYLRGWNYLESQWAGTTGAEVSAHRGLQGVQKICYLQNSFTLSLLSNDVKIII